MKQPTLAFALLLSVMLPSLCGAWSAVAPPSHASFSGRAAAAQSKNNNWRQKQPSRFPSSNARSSLELHALPSAVSAAVSLIRGGAKAASDLDLDRVAFRLEGLEIYSLVMALFMGSALGLMESTPLKFRRGRTAKRTRTRPWIRKSKLSRQLSSR